MEGAGEAAADGAADVMEDMLVDDMDNNIAGGDLDAGGDLGVDVGGDLGGDMGGDMMTENLTAGAGENDDAEEETAAQLAQQGQAPTAWAQDGLGALAYRTGAGASSVGTTKGQSELMDESTSSTVADEFAVEDGSPVPMDTPRSARRLEP